MEQITTKQCRYWGSTGYAWKGQRDNASGGGFMCVEAPEMTTRDTDGVIYTDKLVACDVDEEMKPGMVEPSGLKYPGAPAKEPA